MAGPADLVFSCGPGVSEGGLAAVEDEVPGCREASAAGEETLQ
ncbi:hypothetical protein [Mycobacteroides salmoniphilum]|nr:hypothetical protein [Mycobacteroides salmoniphilum]